MDAYDFIKGINALDRDWEKFVQSKSKYIKKITSKYWEIRLSKSSDIAKKFLKENKGFYSNVKIEFLDKESRFLSDVKFQALKSEFTRDQFLEMVDHIANPKYCMTDKRMFKLTN